MAGNKIPKSFPAEAKVYLFALMVVPRDIRFPDGNCFALIPESHIW